MLSAMNQLFHDHLFISVKIFTDFTSERAKTTDFSGNTYTTDLFSENLTDSVLESTSRDRNILNIRLSSLDFMLTLLHSSQISKKRL